MSGRPPKHEKAYAKFRTQIVDNLTQVAEEQGVPIKRVATGMGMSQDKFLDFLYDEDITLKQLCKMMSLVHAAPYILLRPI